MNARSYVGNGPWPAPGGLDSNRSASPLRHSSRADRGVLSNPGVTVDLDATEAGMALLGDLLESSLVLAEDWQRLAPADRDRVQHCRDLDSMLPLLVEHGLLTEYQSSRIRAGTDFGLVLGNYRVLDRIGAGGMGVVFKAEHILMRRTVAIKVLPLSRDQDPRILMRFLAEMRAIAALQHPNIVTAMDAGRVASAEPNLPVLHYLVMEHVSGKDLEEMVAEQGPLDPVQACDLVHQVACALAEAHNHKMVHRDVKPSNVLVTPENQAKLLDFGLAHDFRNQLTEPGSLLGTLEYMAPEQAKDARSVDIRADIYGLGGTLYWCLTGRLPFPVAGSVPQEIQRRLTDPPPSARAVRPELPAELDDVIGRMMAPKAEDRYANPQAVMRALMPFLKSERHDSLPVPEWTAVRSDSVQSTPSGHRRRLRRVLIVDDEPGIRQFCRYTLQGEDLICDEAGSGEECLKAIGGRVYDLVLLDMEMPDRAGPEVLRTLRESPPCRNLRIIMISGRSSPEDMSQTLLAGADDYIVKPFSMSQLRARVQASLRLKEALDRSDSLNKHLQVVSADLERALNVRDSDLMQVRNALVLGLASIVEHRTTETDGHLMRVQRYCRAVAEEAAGLKAFEGQIDERFVQNLECCAPLHDIGIVALPDHILLKPGKLAPDERVIMQAHTVIGAEILQKVMSKHGSSVMFLRTAIELARFHHEHYSGSGYPDKLVGERIPLAARVLSIGDVYDALRSRRAYRPALSHNAAVQVITEASAGQFDPNLLDVFRRIAPQFERIFTQFPD